MKDNTEEPKVVIEDIDAIELSEDNDAPVKILDGGKPLGEVVNDFITFKFYLAKNKGKLKLVNEKIVSQDGSTVIKEITAEGKIDVVTHNYFEVNRGGQVRYIEFGKQSDWKVEQQGNSIVAVRGMLLLTIQKY